MNSDPMTTGMAPLARDDVYTDFGGMSALRRAARDNPDAALEKVAHQFESVFMRMMLKQMRQASFGDPIFNSHSTKMYRDMFDDQLALQMSQQGGMGLADMLVRQLKGDTAHLVRPLHAPESSAPVASNSHAAVAAAAKGGKKTAAFADPRSFVAKLWPLANQAADKLGTQPQVILAQAALETGWGQHVIQDGSGRSSHNLFNIKADGRWDGPQVKVDTVEYDGPVATRQKAAFRAYDSYADSFDDYVAFLKANPRYQEALDHAADGESFVRKLHEAGYATDPRYADKIHDIMRRELVQGPPVDDVRRG